MTTFDAGPPEPFATMFAQAPDYVAYRQHFWYDWGQVFYRGRLDGSARVLCIASDPGPTERLVGRTLVGDAGQRVQGFLAKLGLTHSYICLNAFTFALHPSAGAQAPSVLADPALRAWRNATFDAVAASSPLEAIVAFGANAQEAARLWTARPVMPFEAIPHPSSRDSKALLDAWRGAVKRLRTTIQPDPDGSTSGPNYGTSFLEADYAPIPRADLPFGVPAWLGDDAWGRTASPRHNNSVARPSPDDGHTLVWRAPQTIGP